MNFKSVPLHAFGSVFLAGLMGFNAGAQVAGSASSATHVSAELTKGKLNPGETKPGDQISLKLKEDMRSNGRVVMKRGSTIIGVVRDVKRIEGKGTDSGAQSMMLIEWMSPGVQGGPSQQLSIALQSVSYVSAAHRYNETVAQADSPMMGAAVPSGSIASSGSGLLGGLGDVTGQSAAVATGVAASTDAILSRQVLRTSGTSNAALMSMPTVVAADTHTSSALEQSFGLPSGDQLYKVGSGEVVSAGGSRQSLELFSHMSNDTVITSRSKNFEISSGAQMQLLIGLRK